MRIAHGLVADDTDRRYGDWRHVATGCNALVHVIFNAVVVAKLTYTPRHRGGAFTTTEHRQRLEAIIRRCIRSGLCAPQRDAQMTS